MSYSGMGYNDLQTWSNAKMAAETEKARAEARYYSDLGVTRWSEGGGRNLQFSGPAPQLSPIAEWEKPDDYVAPEYDEARVRELTQSSAAPAVRGLRSAMQRVSSGSYDNPNVKRMTLREALAGYGQGLQSAISGASDTAREHYATEYGAKADEAKSNWAADVDMSKMKYQTYVDMQMAQYQAALAEYMAKNYGTGGVTQYGSQVPQTYNQLFGG